MLLPSIWWQKNRKKWNTATHWLDDRGNIIPIGKIIFPFWEEYFTLSIVESVRLEQGLVRCSYPWIEAGS